MFVAWGRFGGGLVVGRRTLSIFTALVESSDDGMIRRLQLEDFQVSRLHQRNVTYRRAHDRLALDPDGPVIEMVLSGGERLHIRSGASADLVRAS